jgi:hypothetical protein
MLRTRASAGGLSLLLIALLSFAGCSKDKQAATPLDPYGLSVGASAHYFLSGTTYPSITIEVQYMPGYAPTAVALDEMVKLLTDRCNKPGGVTITQKQILGSGKTLSVNDIVAIEKQNRTVYNTADHFSLYVLVTDGDYTDANVLGIAYRNTSICMFGKTVAKYSGGFGQVSRARLESNTLQHESGHLLGLVGIGSPVQTNHKDPAHPDHCVNTKCLMYFESEGVGGLGGLTGGIPPLDSACVADLRANGGR